MFRYDLTLDLHFPIDQTKDSWLSAPSLPVHLKHAGIQDKCKSSCLFLCQCFNNAEALIQHQKILFTGKTKTIHIYSDIDVTAGQCFFSPYIVMNIVHFFNLLFSWENPCFTQAVKLSSIWKLLVQLNLEFRN